MPQVASLRGKRIHFVSDLRSTLQSCSLCVKREQTLFGQGIVLADTKTAAPSLRAFVPSSAVRGALNAFGLFARALLQITAFTESLRLASFASACSALWMAGSGLHHR